METVTTLFDKIFRDESGKIVIAQMPNLPLIVWGIVSLLRLLPVNSEIVQGLSLLAFGSIFTWAWQELFDGVNYFRRILGLCVLVFIVLSKIQLI